MPRVTIWICPRCGNFYGSSSAGDLRASMNTDAKGRETFPRSRCPDCQTERIPTECSPVTVGEVLVEGRVP